MENLFSDAVNSTANEDVISTESSLENLDSQDGKSGSNIENGQVPAETQEKQDYDPDWWKKDERHKKGLFKDEAAVIKSHYHLDKEFNSKYKPAYSEYQKLNKIFEKLAIKPDKLETHWQEYQTLKDPNNENNQFISKVNGYLQNPEYFQTLQNVFQDLQTRELRRQFPGYNDEQIQEQLVIKEKLNQLEAKEKEREQQLQEEKLEKARVEIEKKVIEEGQEVIKFAEDMGINLTQEMVQKFFDYMEVNGIAPEYMRGVFMQLYEKELFDNYNKKVSDKTLNQLNKQNKNIIPASNNLNIQQKSKLKDGDFESIAKNTFKQLWKAKAGQ
jgi:hypothetical protein